MQSEKVKEIKKALECCNINKNCTDCPYSKIRNCLEIFNADILTLINELESENEKLKQHKRELQGGQHDLCVLNKEQTLRIAELEKENAVKTDTITDLLKKQEFYEKEKLKQFVEMLKEKLEEYRLENEYFIKDEPNGNLWQLNASVFCIEVTQDGGLVDETLKEFININKGDDN